jgi:hypothetical protein
MGIMKNKLPPAELSSRIARELEREHYQRTLNDDARSGLLSDEEYRIKDPRENGGSSKLKRTL